MTRLHVYLTNGDRLSFDDAGWSTHQSGTLEIMDCPNYVPKMLIAHGQWTHVKFEYLPTPEPEATMP